jgi:hypothetical protein
LLAEDDIARLRQELDRLRAENARLSRLLELRGQDTAPAPEQLSAPITPPGLVTMASRSADKLALYADMFKARTDVYAVRWENARTNASGWMPAVAGGWRKGMDRRGVASRPLTAEVVAAHLVGDVFIGLCPLGTGNTCHFLVADFDGSAACSTRSPIARPLAPVRYQPRWRSPSPGAARTHGCSSPTP